MYVFVCENEGVGVISVKKLDDFKWSASPSGGSVKCFVVFFSYTYRGIPILFCVCFFFLVLPSQFMWRSLIKVGGGGCGGRAMSALSGRKDEVVTSWRLNE